MHTLQSLPAGHATGSRSADDVWFSTIFDRLAIGAAVVGLDGHPVLCNPALQEILGYSQAELRSMHFSQFTHLDDVAADSALFDELCRGERDSYQIEKRYIRKDSGIVWARLSISLLLGANGNLTHIIGLLEDVTNTRVADAERGRLLEDLRASEERLRLALLAAQMGIWEWDLASNAVTWSPALERIAGLAAGTFGGTFIAMAAIVHRDDHQLVEQAMRAALRDTARRDVLAVEFRVVRPDGEIRWVASNGRLLRDPTGRPIRLMGMAHDVTDRRQLEQQVRQIQQMDAMGRLAGGIAHDFNNVLTAIKGYSEFLLDAVDPADRRRCDVEEIAAAADRASTLTRQLLAFGRHQVLTPRIVNPNVLVTGLEHMLRRVTSAHIEIRVRLAPEPGTVRVDPGQLEQVMVNLALNARDAMPSGGVLTIETGVTVLDERISAERWDLPPGRYVVLTVSDSGTAMTPETRARLFEPVFTTKEGGRGTELGLATAYGIVQQSGGAIRAASAPGKGSAFEVFLPWVSDALDAITEMPTVPRSLNGSETVLIVDGNIQVRSLAERALLSRGYQVKSAADAEGAVAAIQVDEAPIDLLIADIGMPSMAGPEFVCRLRDIWPRMRVLHLVGGGEMPPQGHALDTGPDVLQKPFTPNALRGAVRAILDQRDQESG